MTVADVLNVIGILAGAGALYIALTNKWLVRSFIAGAIVLLNIVCLFLQ